MFDRPLAFFVYAYNLAETTRAIEIAKALRLQNVDIQFFAHGGTYENLVVEAGFNITTLSPAITPEKHAYLIALDQGRRIGHPFTTGELMAYVSEEIEALRRVQPLAVYAGMNLPSIISARTVGIPLLYLLPIAGITPYYSNGLGTYPDMFEFWMTKKLPRHWKDKLFNWVVPRMRFGIGNFNRVAKSFGISQVRTTLELVKGDLTLVTDLPELTGLSAKVLPVDYRYVGPIFADLPLPVPDEVYRVFSRPGLKIFCAMGSSTPPSILRKAVLALCESRHNAVIATTSILDPAELDPLPENVFATRYLPAPQVNQLADIALTHGGQGTVQTALWAGIPIIGVALQFEQQSNLDMIVRAGVGRRIPLQEFSKERLQTEIEIVSQEPGYRNKARSIQRLIRGSNGAQNAANEIILFIANHL